MRALFGEHFILNSSWNTMVPANYRREPADTVQAGGDPRPFGLHQDGTQVRKTPSWPGSWANVGPLSLYSDGNAWIPTWP